MACSCGLIGTLVISPGSVSPVYTKPIPRGGAAALFSIEVLEIDASVGLAVMVQHKNRSCTLADLSGFSSVITTTGVHSLDMSGFKELVRVRAQYDTGTASGDLARISNMTFSWRPY